MLPSWLPRRAHDDVEPAPYALPPGVPALQSDPALVRLRYTAGLLLVGVCGALGGSQWVLHAQRPAGEGLELREIRAQLEAARAYNALARLASVALIDRGEAGRELAADIVTLLDDTERSEDLRQLRAALVSRAGE